MSEIYQLPDNGNNNGTNIPFSIPIGLGGFGNGGFGFGNGGFNSIADLFGLAIIASMFGWGNGGFGGGFGNNAGGAVLLKYWENPVFSHFKRISFVQWVTTKER